MPKFDFIEVTETLADAIWVCKECWIVDNTPEEMQPLHCYNCGAESSFSLYRLDANFTNSNKDSEHDTISRANEEGIS